MTEQEKITTETNLNALGRGHFGTCVFGGILWVVMAMDSPVPAVMLSVGVGLILTGAIVFYALRILVGMSHSLRTIAGQSRAVAAGTAQ